jgi:hypothetical protein
MMEERFAVVIVLFLVEQRPVSPFLVSDPARVRAIIAQARVRLLVTVVN